jgi:hypothetical protein
VKGNVEKARAVRFTVIGLLTFIFFLDLFISYEIPACVLYVFVILISLTTGSKRYVWVIATVASVLTVAGYFFSSSDGILWMAAFNRFLALFVIWGTVIMSGLIESSDELSDMTGGKRSSLAILMFLMLFVSLIVGAIAFVILYDEALEQTRKQLVTTANGQGRLIEAVARFDTEFSSDYPGGSEAATISQIRDSYTGDHSIGLTGELTLAKRDGDRILFLSNHRNGAIAEIEPMAFESELAEPMKAALSGDTGTMIGRDYRGVKVLAAYLPVAEYDLGIVAKLDLAEIRSPFVKAGFTALIYAALVIFAASVLFVRIGNSNKTTLQYQRLRLSTILDSVESGIVVIDVSGNITSINKAGERLFDYRTTDVLGKNVGMLMPEPDQSGHDGYVSNYLDTGRPKIMGTGRELMGQRRDGSAFPLELTVTEFSVDGQTFFTGIVNDITERKILEKEILSIATEEQRKLGQELHDNVGQELTGLGLYVAALTKHLNALGNPSGTDESVLEQVRNTVAVLSDGLAEVGVHVKQLSRGLIPVQIDAEGLMVALAQLAHVTDQIEGVSCLFDCPQRVDTHDVDTSTNLFRIAQEAVSNALTHSKGTEIGITFQNVDDRIVLEIMDNGVGMDASNDESDSAVNGGGMGIRIMGHRASVIGAEFKVGPGESGGTVVRCAVEHSTPALVSDSPASEL